jgi:arylsulfatase A-like enzyme
VLELAGIQCPASIEEVSVPAAPGRSLVQSFSQDDTARHESLWWLHEGNRAIRMGQWKAVAARDQPWELYDLSVDRGEQTNLAELRPEILSRLTAEWEATTEEFTALSPNANHSGK